MGSRAEAMTVPGYIEPPNPGYWNEDERDVSDNEEDICWARSGEDPDLQNGSPICRLVENECKTPNLQIGGPFCPRSADR